LKGQREKGKKTGKYSKKVQGDVNKTVRITFLDGEPLSEKG